MDKIYKIVATIYKTFLVRKLDIPYFRAICIIVFALFLHAVQIGLLFDIPSKYIMPFNSKDKTIQWFQAAFYFVTLIVIFILLFPKRKLDEQEISETSILKAKKILPWYFVATVLLVIILLLRLGVQKGTIHF
jgi:hypothetical protein